MADTTALLSQPASLSMFRFMSLSVTTVTVINSAVVQTCSYRVWPAASSISRHLCLHTSSSFSLALSWRQTTSSLPSLCGRHRLTLLAVSFSPRLARPFCLIQFLVFFTPCFVIDSNAGWQELNVSFLACSFCFNTAIVKCSCRLKASIIAAGAMVYILTCFSQAVGLTGWFKWLS